LRNLQLISIVSELTFIPINDIEPLFLHIHRSIWCFFIVLFFIIIIIFLFGYIHYMGGFIVTILIRLILNIIYIAPIVSPPQPPRHPT
jgi:hypothetical protein